MSFWRRFLDLRRLASIYIDIPALRPGTVGGYAFGVVCAVASLALRIALDGYIAGAQYLAFFPAVSIATLVSGGGAGLVCTIYSVAAVFYFMTPPALTVRLENPAEIIGLVLFAGFLLVNVLIACWARFAIEAYRNLSLNLQRRVQDGFAEVTERSRALDDTNWHLREANKVFSAIYERGDLCICHLNLEGTIIDANPACVENLGFARTDIIAKPYWETGWWRAEDRKSIRKGVEVALAGDESRAEINYVTGNGEGRVGDMSLTPIKVDGRVVSIVAAALDITERARQYQATFENAAVGIVQATSDLRWGRVNDAMGRIVGYPANELINRPVLDILHPDYREAALRDVERIRIRKADQYTAERRYLRKDGTTVWIRAHVSALRKADGSVDRFVGVVQDMSGRRRAEEMQRRQADLLNQSHDAILTMHCGSRGIVYWNRGAEKLYGYGAAEAEGRRAEELLQTRTTVPVNDIDAQILDQGSWYGELTQTTRDGRDIVVESRIVRVSYDGETFELETNRDISERKRAEEELRKSEERFRISILHSPLPTALFDDREQIIAVSQSWAAAAGLPSAIELQRVEDWVMRAHGERSGEIMELIRGVISTEQEARREELTFTFGGEKRIWRYVTSFLGIQSDGRRLFLTVAQDVTDRKAYEERIELLMHEARHRSKNILSLVQAVARQTAVLDPEDFIDRFTDRTQAMAANLDLLVQTSWTGVDVDDLVHAQLAHFSDLIGPRIILRGPKLRLSGAAAQAIGLAVHELATNAGKYGALSSDGGRVNVAWRSDGRNFTMKWAERGGPPVSPPSHRGFGSTVVESMVKIAVGGEVEIEYPPSGLEWHLTCPAANALESAA